MISEIEATPYLLSDHSPFLVSYNLGLKVISWNILCQAAQIVGPGYSYYNNGFGCANESQQEYKSRLNLIAEKLSAYKEDVDFFALQETPDANSECDYFNSILKDKLNTHELVSAETAGNETNLICLYRKDTFEIDAVKSQTMKEASLSQGLFGRCLPLVLSHKMTDESYLIINVHANFGQEVIHDIDVLEQCASRHGITHITFIGDFNRALKTVEPEYLADSSKKDIAGCTLSSFSVGECKQASFCYKEERSILETRDGHISSKNLEASSPDILFELNKATVNPSSSKAASPLFFTEAPVLNRGLRSNIFEERTIELHVSKGLL